MFNVILAVAAASTIQVAPAPIAAPAPAAAATARTLASIPGVTVTYYDVAGKNTKAIRKSLAAQRPAGAGGEPIAGRTTYDVGADVKKRTVDGKCTITEANLKFTGTAVLPRLTTEHQVDAQTLATWRAYVAGLEAAAAAELAFVRDRLPDIQKAVLASSCEEAGPAMNAALAKIEADRAATRNAVISTPQANGSLPVKQPN